MSAAITFIAALLIALAAFILGHRTHPGPSLLDIDAAEALAKTAAANAAARIKAAQQAVASKQQAAEDAARKAASDAAKITSLVDYLNSRKRR